MPSHRRGGVGVGVGESAPAGSHWSPQGGSICRSEPGVVYYGANLAPLVDVEGWFPGASTGCEVVTTAGIRSGVLRPGEGMGVGGGADVEIINAGGGGFSLAEDHHYVGQSSEVWWPAPVHVQISSNVQYQSQNGTERKAIDVAASTVDPWSFADAAHAVVDALPALHDDDATRDSAPTSALAAVSSAVAEVAAADAVLAVVPAAPAGPSWVTKAATARKPALRKSVSPSSGGGGGAKDTTLAVQKPKGAASVGKRPLTQRQNHIWSERQRRKGMNYLFETLRSLLPHPSPTNKTDKSTVVGEIIKYIQSLQVQLDLLTKKQQQMLAARALMNANVVASSTGAPFCQAPPRAFVSNGLTLVDHSGDPSSLTAITALPPLGRDSCLQSYLGSNVGLHVCGSNIFITTSSPRGRRGLLYELLVTIHKRALDVINATISTSSSSIFHSLHCQASQDAELLNNDLHHALQSVINRFG